MVALVFQHPEEDAAYLDGLCIEIMNTLGIPSAASLRQALTTRLSRDEHIKVKHAKCVLAAATIAGLHDRSNWFLKQATIRVQTKINGKSKVRRVKARQAMRVRDPGTGKHTLAFQYPLIMYSPWEEFEAWLDERTSEDAHRALSTRSYQEIAKLHDLYPDTATPAEAAQRHGLAPDDVIAV